MLLKEKEPQLFYESRRVLQIKLIDCSKPERARILEFVFSKPVKQIKGGSIYIDAY
jgi:hypothetical protein